MPLLKFLGLQQQPFGVTPDSSCVYTSTSAEQAWRSLAYGIENNQGFLLLTAEPGMGKTTLLYRLLAHYHDTARTAFVFQTQCSSQQLLRYLVADLGCGCRERDVVRLHERVNEYLLQSAAQGRRSILVVDEAQNLSVKVLETIRLLSDYESPQKKLLQIILAGQPELLQKLGSKKLSALRERITVSATLSRLTKKEVELYINYRLEYAGYHGQPLFTPEAFDAIADCTGGVPRRINHFCSRALSLIWTEGRNVIDASIILEISRNADLDKVISSECVRELLATEYQCHARPNDVREEISCAAGQTHTSGRRDESFECDAQETQKSGKSSCTRDEVEENVTPVDQNQREILFAHWELCKRAPRHANVFLGAAVMALITALVFPVSLNTAGAVLYIVAGLILLTVVILIICASALSHPSDAKQDVGLVHRPLAQKPIDNTV